jgi:hypothetical protein
VPAERTGEAAEEGYKQRSVDRNTELESPMRENQQGRNIDLMA